MFIPRSVLRYKLLFYAIAFARLVLGLQLTWPSPSLSLGLALYRSTSLPLSVSLSPSRSSSLVFSLTLLYDYFRRSVAHCRLPLTLNFPAAADPCPLALVPTPYLAPALFALFFHFCFFGRVKVVDSAYGPQKMSVKGEEAHWGFHRREGEWGNVFPTPANCSHCSGKLYQLLHRHQLRLQLQLQLRNRFSTVACSINL